MDNKNLLQALIKEGLLTEESAKNFYKNLL